MVRDKAKDDKYFNCSQEHEKDYVSNLYTNSKEVYDFLVIQCNSNEIHYSTHKEVYELIKKELGYPIPV